jgi:hypothetical protein
MVFPGKRVEPQRAGIIPTALFIYPIENNLCGFEEIDCDPIGITVGRIAIESGSNTDRAYAGVATAFGVDFFVDQ